MIIDCISDLHGYKPRLDGGGLLIVAGDLTARDKVDEYLEFNKWLSEQKYDRKIVIAGNHDGLIEKGINVQTLHNSSNLINPILANRTVFLCDSLYVFNNMKIWGSPWTPTFLDWHFMKDRGEPIKQMWDLIPDDTEILITHGPPFGIQDQVKSPEKFAGCEELRNALNRLKKLKLHVFGHVHEGYGKVIVNGVIHVNASIMDEDYNPINKPIRIEI